MPYNTEAYVARLDSANLMKLEHVQLADLGPNELLIEPVAVAICHTDIKAAQGEFRVKPPMIPGHEGSGYVKQIGSNVTTLKPGDAVVLSYASCSVCKLCRSGRNPYCEKLQELNFSGKRPDGTIAALDDSGEPLNSMFFGQSSMSRLILAHESSAVKVDATRDELIYFAPLGCGIQTGAGAIFNVIKPPPGSNVAVFGCGAVGIAAMLAALLYSPSILTLVDISEEKLGTSLAEMATHKINSSVLSAGETAKKLREITGGNGFDFVVDAVGSGSVLGEGHEALAACGTLLSIGGSLDTPRIPISQHLIKGATYRGTHQGDSVSRIVSIQLPVNAVGIMSGADFSAHKFIPFMIDLWRQGKFPFEKMIRFYKFSDLELSIAETKAGKCIKPVLVF